jgi:carbon monoxide dehydrogenase subunit G
MQLHHEFVVPVPVERAWDVLLDVERIAPCLPGATVDSVEGESFAGRVKVKVGPITVTYKGTATFLQRDQETRRVTIRADGREARGPGTAAATVNAVLHDDGERTRVELDTDLAITGRPAQFGRGVMVDVSNKLLGRFADCLEHTLAADQETPAAGGTPEAAPGEPAAVEPGEAAAEEPVEAAADVPAAAVPDVAAAAPPGEAAAALPGEAAAAPGPAARPSAAGRAEPRPTPEAIDLLEAAGVPVLKRALPALSALVVLVLLWRILRRIRS